MKSIRYVALSLMVGFIVGNISKAVLLIDTPIFDVLILFSFLILPFFAGIALFIKR